MEQKTAEQVVKNLRKWFVDKYGDAPDLALYPAEHEQLPEGSWSIAAEGWYGEDGELWAYCIPFGQDTPVTLIFPGVYMEPIAGWCLGLYDR